MKIIWNIKSKEKWRVGCMSERFQILPLGILFQRLGASQQHKIFEKKLPNFCHFWCLAPEKLKSFFCCQQISEKSQSGKISWNGKSRVRCWFGTFHVNFQAANDTKHLSVNIFLMLWSADISKNSNDISLGLLFFLQKKLYKSFHLMEKVLQDFPFDVSTTWHCEKTNFSWCCKNCWHQQT